MSSNRCVSLERAGQRADAITAGHLGGLGYLNAILFIFSFFFSPHSISSFSCRNGGNNQTEGKDKERNIFGSETGDATLEAKGCIWELVLVHAHGNGLGYWVSLVPKEYRWSAKFLIRKLRW